MNFRLLLTALLVFPAVSFPLQANDTAAVMKFGKTKYNACVACHGPDGKGMEISPGQFYATDFSRSAIVKGDPEWMALIIMKGLQKEDARYIGTKTPLETSLDDKTLAAILTYIRNTWGGHDDLVTEAQVAEWRKKYAKTKSNLRRAEIEKLIGEATRKS